jgi:hypothetical protein
MKTFVTTLMMSAALLRAANPDQDRLIQKYKNKFAVVQKDGLTTCIHRNTNPTGNAVTKTIVGVMVPRSVDDMLESDSTAMVFIDQTGKPDLLPRSINTCQYDPLHKGEIVQLTHIDFLGGHMSLALTTLSQHSETRGVGAFTHEELNRGDTRITFMLNQIYTPGKRYPKGAGIHSAADADEVEKVVGQWLALFDSEEAAKASLGNTASGVFVHQVKMGMSFGEVEEALGVPVTRVDLDQKVLYKYKDMTVEFREGKVVDVR